MSTIDIDRDAARDAAQHELSKPIYPRESLTDLIVGWIDDLMHEILARGASVPGGWFTVAVLLVIVALAAFAAFRVARRTMRTNRGHQSTLFGSREMSSAEHRDIARRFAAGGDWGPAIRHRLRAIARHLEETAVLNPVPGRTATELARDAGQAVPGLTGELRRAAEAFNDVTYGERPGTEPVYLGIADLDDHLLARSTPGAGHEPDAMAPADRWAEVR